MSQIWSPYTTLKKTPKKQNKTLALYLVPLTLPPPVHPLYPLLHLTCSSSRAVFLSFCTFFILFVPHASTSSMVLWPSCGPRCLWPADMSRLHSTVLHSAPSFSLVPCSLSSPLAPSCPAAPPAVSKERYATLPLYSFRYVIILSSSLFYYYCYLARWACLCLILLAFF